MQSLQDKASEWSGVATADAFAIDDGNLFEALGGTTQPFVDLSTNFYTRSVHPSRSSFACSFLSAFRSDLADLTNFAAVYWLIASSRVYEDEEEWFREIFAGSKKEDAIQNQYEFLVQRMGGPPLFSKRRGTYYIATPEL